MFKIIQFTQILTKSYLYDILKTHLQKVDNKNCKYIKMRNNKFCFLQRQVIFNKNNIQLYYFSAIGR